MKASREIHHNCWWLWLLFLPLLMLVQHQRPVLAAESDTVLQRSSKTTPPEVNINGPYKFGIATGYELFAKDQIWVTSPLSVRRIATSTFLSQAGGWQQAKTRFGDYAVIGHDLTIRSSEYYLGTDETIGQIFTDLGASTEMKFPVNAPKGWTFTRGVMNAPNFNEYGFSQIEDSYRNVTTNGMIESVSDYYADPNKIEDDYANIERVKAYEHNGDGAFIVDLKNKISKDKIIYVTVERPNSSMHLSFANIGDLEKFNQLKNVIINFKSTGTIGFNGYLKSPGIRMFKSGYMHDRLGDYTLSKQAQRSDSEIMNASNKFIMNFRRQEAIQFNNTHVGQTIAPDAEVYFTNSEAGWPRVAANKIKLDNQGNDGNDYTEVPDPVYPEVPGEPENPEEPEDSNTVEEAVAYLKPESGQEPAKKIDLTQGTPMMSGLMVNQDVNYEIKWQNEEYKLFYRSGDNGAWQPLTSGGTTHYVGSDKLDKLVVTPANNDATKIVVADLPYDAEQKFTFAPEAQKIQFALTQAEEPAAEDWHSEWLILQPGKFEMIVPRLRFGTHKIPEAGQTTKVTAKDAKIQVSDTLKPFFTLSAKINSDRTSVLTEPRNLRAHRQDNLVRYFPSDQPDSSLVFCLMQQDYSFDGDFVFEIKSTYTPTEHRAKIVWTLTTTFNGSKGVIPAAA
ncbi:hypothetical protein [Lacticaseibacillus saniviri]